MTTSIQTLWDEFQNLTAHQRRVVFHMYWDGYTAVETAETMGIGLRTVERALANAESHLKNNLEKVAGFGGSQTLVQARGKSGIAKSGKGLVPTQAPNEHKAPPNLERPADSQCPPPDIYDALLFGGKQSEDMPERDVFLESLNQVCASAFLQLMDKGGYNESARLNRARISQAVS